MTAIATLLQRGMLAACASMLAACAGTLAPDRPAVVAAQSDGIFGLRVFHVGTSVQTVGGRLAPVGQARVEHLQPRRPSGVPLILYPGLGLGGAIYLGTPDGRSGWAQDFAAAGHPVYVYDPVNTGPSGIRPDTDRLTYWDIDEIWLRWGFGTKRDMPYADTRFPIRHIAQFYAAMSVRPPMGRRPPSASTTPGPNQPVEGAAADPNIGPLTELLRQTGPAVILAHSWASHAAEEIAARNPELVAGIVLVEPASCPPPTALAAVIVPRLLVYGDRIESRGQSARFEQCGHAIRALGAAGRLLDLPARGIARNGHIMMQEDNSRQIAGMIMAWIRDRPNARR
jgi:pimeloyl-ACP methyl ester carboxylesterase